IACLTLLLLVISVQAASAARPLRTGFLDPEAFGGSQSARSAVRAQAAGATLVRLSLVWNSVAPHAPDDPEDPDDPAYRWGPFDQQVVDAVEGGLDPVVYISGSVLWARGPAVG